jgi:hypothetical protein
MFCPYSTQIVNLLSAGITPPTGSPDLQRTEETQVNWLNFREVICLSDRLCGLVVSVEDYKHIRFPGTP